MYEAIVKRHKPQGWVVRTKKLYCDRAATYKVELLTKKRLTSPLHTLAETCVFDDGTKFIYIPKVVDEFTLQIVLHEFGHVRLGHLRADYKGSPSHKEEWEAERWAINVMRTEGVVVTKEVIRSMRRYLKRLLAQDEAKGKPIHRPVRKFVERTDV